MTQVRLTTSLGPILIELDDKGAPLTTENFLKYVNSGFYNGTVFHRVIKGFMIQGGGFEPNMAQKQAEAPIRNEAKTGLKNATGTIAMARTSDPHSASSQFFINVNDNDFLNFKAENLEGYGYCAFGKVVDGLDVVQKISVVPTSTKAGHGDVPVEDVYLLGAEVV